MNPNLRPWTFSPESFDASARVITDTRGEVTRGAKLTDTQINRAYEDARRAQRVQDGAASRPERDLKGATFAMLHDQPWKVALALDMAYFAQSSDIGDDWPLDRFAAKLAGAGLELPAGMTIADAVAWVDTAIAESKPKWYDANIGLPMGRRISSVAVGTESIHVDEANNEGDHGRVDVLREKDAATIGLNPDNKDRVPHELVEFYVVLEAGAASLDAAASSLERQGRTAIPGTLHEARSLYRAKVLRAAAAVIRALLDASGHHSQALVEALEHALIRGESIGERVTPATHPLIVTAALAADATIADGPLGAEFCTDIAHAVRAIATSVVG